MPKLIDLTGRRFGRLTVVSLGEKSGVSTRFFCRCDCGSAGLFFSNNLRRGLSQSCGCARAEQTALRNTTHGLARTDTHEIWCGMLKRCTNSRSKNFGGYGGRGIAVCKRWESFEGFLADMGPRPPGMSLDRIDNDGNYSRENCRWATRHQQANNTRTNRHVEHDGIRRTLMEWSRATGLDRKLISCRLDRGWGAERALSTPAIEKFRRHDQRAPRAPASARSAARARSARD